MLEQTENLGKIVPHNIAMQLLTQGNVHVAIIKEGNQDKPALEDVWLRQRVEDFVLRHGARFAGPAARAANHGVFAVDEAKTWYFFETKHW